jgi:hypothetical protein
LFFFYFDGLQEKFKDAIRLSEINQHVETKKKEEPTPPSKNAAAPTYNAPIYKNYIARPAGGTEIELKNSDYIENLTVNKKPGSSKNQYKANNISGAEVLSNLRFY